MKYNPDDLVEMEPVEERDYKFTLVNATETVSKSGGNHMIELEHQFEVGRSKPLTVYGRLVVTPNSLWVVRDFCNAVSPRIDFRAGELLPANIIGATGKAHLVLGEENAKGKRYMQVGYYIVPDDKAADTKVSATEAPARSGTNSDSVPF